MKFSLLMMSRNYLKVIPFHSRFPAPFSRILAFVFIVSRLKWALVNYFYFSSTSFIDYSSMVPSY